jgi:hypothetical protein
MSEKHRQTRRYHSSLNVHNQLIVITFSLHFKQQSLAITNTTHFCIHFLFCLLLCRDFHSLIFDEGVQEDILEPFILWCLDTHINRIMITTRFCDP